MTDLPPQQAPGERVLDYETRLNYSPLPKLLPPPPQTSEIASMVAFVAGACAFAVTELILKSTHRSRFGAGYMFMMATNLMTVFGAVSGLAATILPGRRLRGPIWFLLNLILWVLCSLGRPALV